MRFRLSILIKMVKAGHIEKLCRMAEDNSLFMFSFKIKYSWIAILTLMPGVIPVYPGEVGKPL